MWSLCSVNPIFKRKGAIVIRERAGKNFDSVQSLVDTRSVNFIRKFSIVLFSWNGCTNESTDKSIEPSLRCALKNNDRTSSLLLVLPGRQDSLYFKGWTPLIIVFCCLHFPLSLQVAAHFVLAPLSLLRS